MQPQTSSRRDKHHFLARHLLQNFAEPNGLAYVYDREDGWASRQDLPIRLALENHLYAPGSTDESGRDPNDDSVERWLEAEVDTPADTPLRKLNSGSTLEDLTEDERHAMANFIALLDMRTPRVRDIMIRAFSAGARQAITDTKSTRKALARRGIYATQSQVRRAERRHTTKILGELVKPGWLQFLKDAQPLARLNIKSRRLSLVDAPTRTEFVTNDLGIVKSLLGPMHPATWEPGTSLGRAHWLVPISPWRALAITPIEAPEDPIGTEELVRGVNRQMFLDARRYAFSRGLVIPNELLKTS